MAEQGEPLEDVPCEDSHATCGGAEWGARCPARVQEAESTPSVRVELATVAACSSWCHALCRGMCCAEPCVDVSVLAIKVLHKVEASSLRLLCRVRCVYNWEQCRNKAPGQAEFHTVRCLLDTQAMRKTLRRAW